MTVHMPVVELRRFYYNRGVCLLIVRDPTKHTGRQLWVAFRTVPITSLKFYWDQPFLIGFTGWNFSYLGKKNGLIETVQRAFSWTCHVIVARVWTISRSYQRFIRKRLEKSTASTQTGCGWNGWSRITMTKEYPMKTKEGKQSCCEAGDSVIWDIIYFREFN